MKEGERKNCSRVVEFFGLPGSGKSTLAALVTAELEQDGLLYDNYMHHFMSKGKPLKAILKLLAMIKQLLISPRHFVRMVRIIANTKQRSTKYLIRLIAQYFFLAELVRSSREMDKRLILDEGIYHFIWSLCFDSRRELDIKGFLSLSFKPDIIVALNVNDAAMRKRLLGRSYNYRRLDKYASDNNIAMLENAKQIYNAVLKYISLENISRIEIDNSIDGNEERNSKTIKNTLLASEGHGCQVKNGLQIESCTEFLLNQ